MVRLKWKKSDNKLVSKPVVAGNGSVVVNLNTDDLIMTVVSFDTGEILHISNELSLARLKSKAKIYLKQIGAVFNDEVRDRSVRPTEANE